MHPVFVSRWLRGRQRARALKNELDTVKEQNARLNDLLDQHGEEFAKMRTFINEREIAMAGRLVNIMIYYAELLENRLEQINELSRKR